MMKNELHRPLAFYLKVNRIENYTIRNLERWLEIVSNYGENVDYYIICDNEYLVDRIVCKLSLNFGGIEKKIIQSISNEDTEYIISNVTDSRWHNAGIAHITTFLHAKKCGYDYFWNIDADDTRFCLNTMRTVELLKITEQYANDKGIDIFSLDMHASRIGSGRHWSFGISYTNNTRDWFGVMRRYCVCDQNVEDKYPNFDRFFRYIKNHDNVLSIQSFYFENLKFIHYSNDFLWRLCESGLYHWKNGELIFPILYYGVGLQSRKSRMSIDKNVVKLEMNIRDEEMEEEMLETSSIPTYFLQ